MDITVCSGQHERLIITDHALVTVQVSTTQESQRILAHVFGGLLGAAITEHSEGALLGGGSQSVLNLGHGKAVPPLHYMQSVTTCFASEVPPELAESKGWPRVADFRTVVFYPRTLISEIRVGWTGSVEATLPGTGHQLEMAINPFSVWKARDALRRWGYSLR
jgi:hypothetical protein